MRLKPSSYLILSLVRGGMTSGYAIRKFIEQQRMAVFWATTFAQVYPDLAQLEEGGYLTHDDDPHGARQRRVYGLTPTGERALMTWLAEEAIELVQRLRARAEAAEREFRETILPLGEALLAAGLRFPIEIGRMGAGYYAWSIEHLTQLEADLRAEQS